MGDDLLGLFNATAAPLRIPRNLKERVLRYVRQHQGGALIAEQAPFRRQLDLWAAGVAVACARGLEPRTGESASWGDKFVDTRGVQLSRDLAAVLCLVAAAEYGIQDDRIGNASEVVELANRYAAVGVPLILEWLEDPSLRETNMEKVLFQLTDLRVKAAQAAGLDLSLHDV